MVVGVGGSAKLRVLGHGNHATGAGLDTSQRGVHVIPVGGSWLGSVHSLLSHGLSLRVQGGHNLQTATLNSGVTQLSGSAQAFVLKQVVHHVAAEEGLVAAQRATLRLRLDVELNIAGDGFTVFLIGNLTVTQHGAEHHVAALAGQLRVHSRIVHVRCLHQTRNQCGLGHVQVLSRDTPVVLCGSLDTVVGSTQVHDVQVALKNLVLGLILLHRDRKLHLTNLCSVRLVTVEGCGRILTAGHRGIHNQVVDVLLSQGGSTLAAAIVGVNDVVEERTANTDCGDRTVLVEVAVLNRNDGVLHMLRNLVQLNRIAVLIEEGRDFGGTVRSVNRRGTREGTIRNIFGEVLEP